jgi:hypothetical protein
MKEDHELRDRTDPRKETRMTDSTISFAEAQLNFSDALFRLWMQPLKMTQAALMAGTELIAASGETAHPAGGTAPEVVEAAEEMMAHLDEDMDRAVPEAAAIVA